MNLIKAENKKLRAKLIPSDLMYQTRQPLIEANLQYIYIYTECPDFIQFQNDSLEIEINLILNIN